MVEQEAEGLSDALSGSGEPAVITPFRQLPKLSVLSAGPIPSYPAEMLGSGRMQALVEAWSSSYDYVLIDSPPILAVADALILARLADTTLLVARHGRSTQKSLERAYKTLSGIENTNIGVVVNGVNPNSGFLKEFYGCQLTSYYKEA
jgi:Mrp family chromosome partitioning ATPase